jgi:polyisoprenoid-binding protein YceI
VIPRCAAALLLLAAAGPALAAPETYRIDPVHTIPGFEVTHLGISTQRGRFNRTTGAIALDAEAGTGSIQIDIDATSISTGNRLYDATLRGEDFFHVERYPRLVFRAHRMAFDHGVPVRAEGELTMLGVTRPVTLQLQNFACSRAAPAPATCAADIATTVSRSAFGMTSYALFIGDEVRLVIQAAAVRIDTTPSDNALPGG